MLRNLRYWIRIAGPIFSLLLSIVVAGLVFLRPRAPFVAYENDVAIGLVYLLVFLGAGVLYLLNAGRALSLLAWGMIGGLIFVAARTPKTALSLLLLCWILWLSWRLGKQLLKRIAPRADWPACEGDVLSLALGWGVLMALTLFLGVSGIYQRWVFYALLVVLSIWGAFSYHQDTETRRKTFKHSLCSFVVHPNPVNSLHLFLLVIFAAGSFLWSLAPAVRYDALSYHLAVPLRYLAAGRMLELPESFQTYSAHYGEMLYTLALGIGTQPLPTLLNFSAGLLLAAQTYSIGRRLGGHATGLIAALLLYSLPIIGIESATAYTDIFVAVFVTAAVQIFLHWRESLDDRWLFLMGIFSGLALGTKLNAFFLLLPFWFLVFNAKAQKTPGTQSFFSKISSRLGVKFFSRLLLPMVLLWLPWLLRDFIWTGNPIFPNYNQIFHSPDWFAAPFFRIQPTGGIVWRMFAFPWAGITDSYRYYHEAPGALLGALPLLSFPWLYDWRKHRGLFLAFIAALVMIFAYGGSVRYLMPLFPLLSALAALNIKKIVSGFAFYNANSANERMARISFKINSRHSPIRVIRDKNKPLRFAIFAFFALGMLYLISTRLAFTARWWEIPERYPVGIWLDTETQEEFVERILPVYGAFEYLDALGQFKVFSVGNELRLYTDSAIYGPLFSKEAFVLLH
ncbi:MAG: DUF1420 family protein, partial [Chloroflexi bacterium]|nr:DUF1420 family protein [Chloroflexota bacterium]